MRAGISIVRIASFAQLLDFYRGLCGCTSGWRGRDSGGDAHDRDIQHGELRAGQPDDGGGYRKEYPKPEARKARFGR